MTFLRGKSTSYSRLVLPAELTIEKLDRCVHDREFKGIPEDELEAVGFCSYRNLLDSSVDRGFVNATDLWLTGLRRDKKRAPVALVRAQVARALAEARQISPNLSKQAERDIAKGVKLELDLRAQAAPAHAGVFINTQTRLGYVDGIPSAYEWLTKALESSATLYQNSALGSQYLAWCAWRAENSVDTPCSPNGDITFREPADAGAAYDGQTSISDLLDYWMKQQRAKISEIGLVFDVEVDGDHFNANVRLQAATLKVCALEFPEDILEAGNLDEKLANRLGFVAAFESALAKDYSDFLALSLTNSFPEKFADLLKAE